MFVAINSVCDPALAVSQVYLSCVMMSFDQQVFSFMSLLLVKQLHCSYLFVVVLWNSPRINIFGDTAVLADRISSWLSITLILVCVTDILEWSSRHEKDALIGSLLEN